MLRQFFVDFFWRLHFLVHQVRLNFPPICLLIHSCLLLLLFSLLLFVVAFAVVLCCLLFNLFVFFLFVLGFPSCFFGWWFVCSHRACVFFYFLEQDDTPRRLVICLFFFFMWFLYLFVWLIFVCIWVVCVCACDVAVCFVLFLWCWLKHCLAAAETNWFSAKYVCMLCFVLCLDLFFFRSVCHVCFTCMLLLYKMYVLGVRMYVLGVYMFMVSVAACFALILYAGWNIVFGWKFFQPSMFVCFILLYVWVYFFSFCLSRVFYTCMLLLYKMYVLGVCMFMVSVAACFALLLHADWNIAFGWKLVVIMFFLCVFRFLSLCWLCVCYMHIVHGVFLVCACCLWWV